MTRLAIEAVFVLSSLLTIFLILRRPYLYMRLFRRRLRVQSYFLGALVGPVLILAFGIMSCRDAVRGLEGHEGLSPLGILALFLSMVFMSVFLDITGFFEFCARVALRFAKADGRRLFFSLYATVSILTVFTSNDIIILTFTPFVYYFAREAKIDPKPYLIAEFFAANTWSMALYIGNPTNILVASAFNLGFVEYAKWMLLPTAAAGAVSAGALYLVFRRSIERPLSPRPASNPADAITDRTGAAVALAVLGGCIVALAVGPYFGVEMWLVSLAFAVTLAAVLGARDSYARFLKRSLANSGANDAAVGATLARMPWTIVPFVLSLFVTVEALRVHGVTGEVGRLLWRACSGSAPAAVFVYGTTSALAANALNNIPMTLAFASGLEGLEGRGLLAAALGTTVGSNLGANITPIGALAGIMWMSILKGKDFHISFGEFVRCGLVVTPLTLAACLGVLAAELAMF